MRAARLGVVLVVAGVAFVIAASLIAANARPAPGPCNDTVILEPPVGDSVGSSQPAPICAAPEAPAWMVLGGGTIAAGTIVAAYALLTRRQGASPRSQAQVA